MRRGLTAGMAVGVALLVSGCGEEKDGSTSATDPDPEPTAYRFDVSFEENTRLEPGSDVRIAGISVGEVTEVESTSESVDATIEIEPKFAPIEDDARAILRQRTLLGETYVELVLPSSPIAEASRGGGRPPTLQEIYRTFDPEARQQFKEYLRENGFDPTATGP